MCASGSGGGKDIMCATFAQFKSFSDVGDGEGEISHGDVGLGDALEFLSEFPFVECRDVDDLESASGEIVVWYGGDEQVAAG